MILKLFKLLFSVSITSFILKFAIARSLDEGLGFRRKYETFAIGLSLERTVRYHTIRGKFHEINQNLQKIGLKKIKIDFQNAKLGFIFI